MSDQLDGCEIDFRETFAKPGEPNVVRDEEIDFVVLFADTPPEELEAKAQAYQELFGA